MDENDINTHNIPFYYANASFIGKDKKIKLKPQYFVIFTCIFLLKIFASSKQIYIDATFKVTPKIFYQTLIIIAKDSLSNLNKKNPTN